LGCIDHQPVSRNCSPGVTAEKLPITRHRIGHAGNIEPQHGVAVLIVMIGYAVDRTGKHLLSCPFIVRHVLTRPEISGHRR
jgi:hypothetical protein